jgi:hypothetical protein
VRASELIGAIVHDPQGAVLGRIVELHTVLDGPMAGAATQAAPRIHAVTIARTRTAAALGYQQHRRQGPWLIRSLVDVVQRPRRTLAWSALSSADGRITAHV